jgi:hypothetical protein
MIVKKEDLPKKRDPYFKHIMRKGGVFKEESKKQILKRIQKKETKDPYTGSFNYIYIKY